MKWRTVASTRQRLPHHSEQRVAAAYREVFNKPTEDIEIVLADLAAQTGFYLVDPPGADFTLYQAGYKAGQRAAFGRILQFLTLSGEQLQALEIAARQESEQLHYAL